MKYSLSVLTLLLVGCKCLAQCAVTPILKYEGSLCLGMDTLIVSSPTTPSKITWYNGTIADTTVTAMTSPVISYKAVAGDNGVGNAANQLSFPCGIFMDASGNLYVADADNNRIQKFPPGSFYTTDGITVAGGNGAGPAANQLSGPEAIYVDPAGNLYVADSYNGRIQKFPPGSTSATNGTTVAGGNGNGPAANQFEPTGVCLDAAGNLYVTDYSNARILKFPPGSTGATNGTTIGGGNGPGPAANQLQAPYSGMVDGGGNVYVIDQSNQRVQKFSPGSTSATNAITVAGGNGLGPAPNQLYDPSAIFLDNSGNLYVDDMENNRVQEFPPGSTSATNGITVASGESAESALDFFIGSYGIFLDNMGDIYFSVTTQSRVVEIIPTNYIDTIYIPTAPGAWSAVVTYPSGCTVTTNAITISAYPPPTLTIAADSTAACAGDTLLFIASAMNAGPSPTWQWQVNGNNMGANSDTLILSSLLNNDLVSCILTSHTPCQVSVSSLNSISVTIYPLPVVTFSSDTVFIKGGTTISLAPIITGAITTWQWTPTTDLNNPEIMSPLANPVSTTTYHLTVTSGNGCQASGKQTVFVYYPLEMPNAFTPNGDGRNDVFRIPPSISLEIKSFAVYDRWGMRVFETANSSIGWDGTVNGKPQPAGTYVWMIEYRDPVTGKAEAANGTVILVR